MAGARNDYLHIYYWHSGIESGEKDQEVFIVHEFIPRQAAGAGALAACSLVSTLRRPRPRAAVLLFAHAQRRPN